MTPPKPNRRITAEDVAKRAGVSRSAVSRAFTEGAYIHADKRALVLQAASDLGYRPNALGAGLQGARSNLVAIFVGEIANDYDHEVTAALVAGLNSVGKWPIVISGSGAAARDAVNKVLSYPLEAMILRSGSLDEDIVNTCGKLNIPVISSGRILKLAGVDNVYCRNTEAMQLGTRLLIDKGRRRFGFIGGPESYSSSAARRLGVVEALTRAGLALEAEAAGHYSVQSGYDAAMALRAVPIDALICANDAMAIGALTALKDQGRAVPRDISVIGFDNSAMAGWPAFALTTLDNPVDALVAAVLGLLQRRSAAPLKPDETVFLQARLVLRSSH
jgi:DNA-binding LacI/PurR family transcriptional regulator